MKRFWEGLVLLVLGGLALASFVFGGFWGGEPLTINEGAIQVFLANSKSNIVLFRDGFTFIYLPKDAEQVGKILAGAPAEELVRLGITDRERLVRFLEANGFHRDNQDGKGEDEVFSRPVSPPATKKKWFNFSLASLPQLGWWPVFLGGGGLLLLLLVFLRRPVRL